MLSVATSLEGLFDCLLDCFMIYLDLFMAALVSYIYRSITEVMLFLCVWS